MREICFLENIPKVTESPHFEVYIYARGPVVKCSASVVHVDLIQMEGFGPG